MGTIDIELLASQQARQRLKVLAVRAHQQSLRAKLRERDSVPGRQAMVAAGNQFKAFGEQRPIVEPLPGLAERGSDGEFGLAALQELGDLRRRSAQQLDVH